MRLGLCLRECATAKGCHGEDPTDSVTLDLRREHAWAELAGRPSLDANTGAPILPSPIPPDFIERTLEPWIAAGAPNN